MQGGENHSGIQTSFSPLRVDPVSHAGELTYSPTEPQRIREARCVPGQTHRQNRRSRVLSLLPNPHRQKEKKTVWLTLNACLPNHCAVSLCGCLWARFCSTLTFFIQTTSLPLTGCHTPSFSSRSLGMISLNSNHHWWEACRSFRPCHQSSLYIISNKCIFPGLEQARRASSSVTVSMNSPPTVSADIKTQAGWKHHQPKWFLFCLIHWLFALWAFFDQKKKIIMMLSYCLIDSFFQCKHPFDGVPQPQRCSMPTTLGISTGLRVAGLSLCRPSQNTGHE